MKNISRLILLAFFASTVAVGSYVIPDLGVTTRKIAASAVTTAKINDLAVTTAKINDLAVTQAKRAALGQQLSSAIAGFTTSSTSFVDVTGASVSITTTGRPVWVGLQGSGVSSANAVACSTLSATIVACENAILRSGTTISDSNIGGNNPAGTSYSFTIPPSSFWYIDVPSAGTYTYKLQTKVNTGTVTSGFSNIKLIAYEL